MADLQQSSETKAKPVPQIPTLVANASCSDMLSLCSSASRRCRSRNGMSYNFPSQQIEVTEPDIGTRRVVPLHRFADI